MYFRHLRDCWAWAEAELNPISEERGAVGEALYNPEVFPHERSDTTQRCFHMRGRIQPRGVST
jgi:hypothetical protein